MFLSVRSDDPVIGPLESTGGRVRAPRIYEGRELAGLLVVGLLSIVGAAVAVTAGGAPAKLSDSGAEGHDLGSATSHDQQAAYAPLRAAEPAVEGEATLDGRSSVSEVHTVGQEAPTSSKSYEEQLAHPPAPVGNAVSLPDFSGEPSPVPSQPPVSPVLLRPVDRTALQNLTVSLLAVDHSRPKQRGPPTTSAVLAQSPRQRQLGRTASVQKRGMSGHNRGGSVSRELRAVGRLSSGTSGPVPQRRDGQTRASERGS
jgi:hypothetical protein